MKKLSFLLAALLMAVITPVSADSFSYLAVTSNGASSSYAISSIKSITFDTQNMLLNLTDGSQTQVPLEGLSKMFFTNDGTTSIGSATKSRIEVKEGAVRVSLAKGESVTVYNLKGQVVTSALANEGEVELSLGSLSKGTYIIKVGNETKKVSR